MWWDFSKINSLLGLWFGCLKRKRLAFLFFPLLFCLILAGGVVLLQENNDGRIFFDEASPDRQKLVALEEKFTETNSLLIVLSADGGDVFAADVMSAILDVTEQAWLLPYVTRVNSLGNYQRISSMDDDIIIESLFSPDSILSATEREEIKKYALSETDLIGQILSPDGAVTAVAINIAAPRGDSKAINVIMAEVESLKEDMQSKYSGISLYITGDIPLDNAFAEAYAYDLQYLFPFFLCVIFLVCYFFFRSFLLSAVILVMMILVVAATMGSSGFLGIDLTAGTSAVPIILITISLADFVHLLSAVRIGMRRGLDEMQAVQRSLERNFLPISLTSFTTLIGFLSLNFSEAPPFRDLGNLVAIGIVISYLITFTFFPAVLVGMKLSHIFKKSHSVLTVPPGVISDFISRFSHMLLKRRAMVSCAAIFVAVVISSGLTRIEFDDDWVKYFDEKNNFRMDTEFVVGHLTGVDTIEYIISSGKEGGVTDARFLNELDQFGAWALAQPEIIHVSSIVSLFKKINAHMSPLSAQETTKAETHGIAENSELNAQYLLMYEMSLPVGLDLNDRIDIAKQFTRLTLTARDMTSRQMRNLDFRVSQKLREMKLIKPDESGTGIPLMFANLSERNIKSMLFGILFALVMVSVVLTVAFKSLSLGLISFFVNILPIILGFGIWGWLYQYIGVSLTVVAAIAFGIVVDDSIHFITKYSKAIKEKKGDVTEALITTFREVGGALVMTTFILVMGFLILSFSQFQPTWGLGLISAMMITIALLYDFILLPILLTISRRKIS
ncbi:MAG: MMPL family transporter [Emcibacter sp.]|nr:MMPL family transporter [Emcibacter sp.]